MFFWARKVGFRPENPFFCHATLNFVNGPFVALRETVHFAPWDRFFDFSSPIYGCFRKKISQELRMLSRSLSDRQSLAITFMISVSQFVLKMLKSNDDSLNH